MVPCQQKGNIQFGTFIFQDYLLSPNNPESLPLTTFCDNCGIEVKQMEIIRQPSLMIYGKTDQDRNVGSIEDNAILWKTAVGAVRRIVHVVWNFQGSHYSEVV